jgi:propionyl-CoA carboxylase alpha chain
VSQVAPKRSIDRLLVANRGEIARRVFATCRRLGISTVAVFSEPDAGEPFVREADLGVPLGGRAPAESYLRGDAIIEAARRTGAAAVHPGYGFLAENADFARAVLDAGLVWVGPSPEAIAAVGSKTEARARMEAAGVPVLPGAHLDGEVGDALRAVAEGVGFPMLVKAAAGGGGKGMRLVEAPTELEEGVEAARREAAGAFGDDAVFLERFAPRARHVEIQIVGDVNGRVASLHERDCSVQRRHQKVIEETPSPALDEDLRAAMSASAVSAGESLGYVGAGTVEFLLTEGGEFFFLEVNTRLQVEHPVTELVTGLDLVELQLGVAEGWPLPEQALDPPLDGHAVEARLYAEDAAHDFLPVTGTLDRFGIDGDVRVDTGVEDGSVISPFYDPMVAKVVAHGRTREDAARRLADALARAELHGARTNRDFLVRVLRHREFLAGDADTSFLDRHDPAALAEPLVDPDGFRLAAAAAALARQAQRRSSARVLGTLPSGWRNHPLDAPQPATFFAGEEELRVGYRFARDGSLATLRVGDEHLEGARLHACTAELVDLEVEGVRRRYRVGTTTHGRGVHVNTAEGQVDLVEVPRFVDPAEAAEEGTLTAPMPGKVTRLLVKAGTRVTAGQPLLALEAMKMEHEFTAPADGVLAELRVEQGDQVETGAVLAVVEEAG